MVEKFMPDIYQKVFIILIMINYIKRGLDVLYLILIIQ